MRLLLDTHIFLWAVTANRRLKPKVREYLLEAESVFVSAASIWEISIKSRLGKLDGDPLVLANSIPESGFEELAISAKHAAAVHTLPMHHADPFDRMILAQAFLEPLRLVTADRALAAYGGSIEFV